MKKLMKKLAAIALAGAMALSCCAMSFATEVDTLGGGESAGTGENESNKLEHPMRVVLPTESATAFNMKLDPHELIKSTNAARYSGATFDYSTKLFFNTTGTNWSGNSPTLVVENKGDVDVSLGVDVTVEKNGADFTFMNSAEDLDDTANAAQMYLALVSGQTVKPIELATPKVLGTDKTNASADTPLIAGVAFAYDNSYTDAAKKAAFEAAAAGKSVTFAVSATAELSIASPLAITGYTITANPTDVSTLGGDGTDEVEFTIADSEGDTVGALTVAFEAFQDYETAVTGTASFKMVADPNYTPAVTGKANFTNSAPATPVVASAVFAFDTNANDTAKEALATAADGKSFELTVDENAGLSISSALDIGSSYTVTSNPTNVASIQDNSGTLVLTINDGTSDVATVTVGFVDFSNYTAETTATVTLKVGTAGGDGAVNFKTSIPKTEGAYADQWVAAEDEYQRKPVETVTEFEKVAFYLSGDINASDAWDDNGTGVKITVTWQLAEYDPEAYAEVGGSEGPSGGAGGGNVAANAQPTLRMTTAPTGTSGETRNTVLTYTEGTGDYDGYAPSAQMLYKRSGATTDTSFTSLTIDTDAKTISFVSASAVQNGSDHRIVFTKAGADDIEVAFTGYGS
jgi:hypothetical protein